MPLNKMAPHPLQTDAKPVKKIADSADLNGLREL